jgi:hypothetical protein
VHQDRLMAQQIRIMPQRTKDPEIAINDDGQSKRIAAVLRAAFVVYIYFLTII